MGDCLPMAWQTAKHDHSTYPDLSLQQARLHALTVKEKIKQGIDPKQAKPTAVLFGDVARAYHDSRNPNHPTNTGKKTVTPSTYQKDFNLYQRDIAPKLAHIDIKAITPAMVLDVISAIDKRGAGDMARRANRQIGAIYDYAIIHDQYNGISPHKGLEKRLQDRQEIHFSRIEFSELTALFADIDNSNCEPLTKLAFRFMCYTFVRTKEMRFMTWDEIDWQACLWRIPAKRMKMRKDHLVPLSRQAIELQLAHQKSDKVAGAYDHSKHIPYRANMLQDWADMVDEQIGV